MTGTRDLCSASGLFRSPFKTYLLHKTLRKRKQPQGDPDGNGTQGYPDNYGHLRGLYRGEKEGSYVILTEQDVLLFRTHPDFQEYSVRNAVGIRVLKGKRVFSPTVVLQSFQTFCIIMHNKPNLKSKSIVSSIEKNL